MENQSRSSNASQSYSNYPEPPDRRTNLCRSTWLDSIGLDHETRTRISEMQRSLLAAKRRKNAAHAVRRGKKLSKINKPRRGERKRRPALRDSTAEVESGSHPALTPRNTAMVRRAVWAVSAHLLSTQSQI